MVARWAAGHGLEVAWEGRWRRSRGAGEAVGVAVVGGAVKAAAGRLVGVVAGVAEGFGAERWVAVAVGVAEAWHVGVELLVLVDEVLAEAVPGAEGAAGRLAVVAVVEVVGMRLLGEEGDLGAHCLA